MLEGQGLSILVDILGLEGNLVDTFIIGELELGCHLVGRARSLQCHSVVNVVRDNLGIFSDSSGSVDFVGLLQGELLTWLSLELEDDGLATIESGGEAVVLVAC